MRPHPGALSVHLSGEQWGRIHELVESSGLRVYFLEHHHFFSRERLYDDGQNSYPDNPQRFAFLSRAAIDLADFLQWTPDIFHVHDWMAAPVPVFLETEARHGKLRHSASVLTVHNLAHQGYAHHSILSYAGLPESLFRSDQMEACGGVNFLKGGLYFANKLTTVSPSYAREIQTPDYGCGLHDVLRFRSGDLIGILNGIDINQWNPATDPHIPHPYDAKGIANKFLCKKEFCRECGLVADFPMPLFGVIARLHWQKGLEMLAEILPEILRTMSGQFAILGSGDRALEERFQEIARQNPGCLFVHIGHDEKLAHQIEAASDFFVMPSRFEPCGLNQLYSLRYGTLPIVRRTGGLQDTVLPYDESTGSGTGFFFDDLTPTALYDTIGWACSTYHDRPAHIAQMIRRAMATDFSWAISANRYRDCYRWALEMKAGK
jgi:starch synthase